MLAKPTRATQFDIAKVFPAETITHGLEHAMATGNWSIGRFRMERKGVTQVRRRVVREEGGRCAWRVCWLGRVDAGKLLGVKRKCHGLIDCWSGFVAWVAADGAWLPH